MKDNFPINTNDNLLEGFTIQELIDTIAANEAWHDEIRIKKVFNELMEIKTREAKVKLKNNMNFIINELIEGK